MGHADIQTTMLYVHHVPKAAAADELTRAVQRATAGHPEVESARTLATRAPYQ